MCAVVVISPLIVPSALPAFIGGPVPEVAFNDTNHRSLGNIFRLSRGPGCRNVCRVAEGYAGGGVRGAIWSEFHQLGAVRVKLGETVSIGREKATIEYRRRGTRS